MKKWKRVAIVVGTLIALCIVALLLFWRPIVAYGMLWSSIVQYKDNFRSGREIVTLIADDDYAVQFAGARGLNALRDLSEDEALLESGRTTASNLASRISNGDHLWYYNFILAENAKRGGSYIQREYVEYLREYDRPTVGQHANNGGQPE
jgi:hypothetical protein